MSEISAKLRAWSGQALADESVIALAIVAGKPRSDSLVAVGQRDEPYHVELAELKDFLIIHRQCIFVAWNAAQLHWELSDGMRRINDVDGDAEVWQLAAERRLVDLQYYEQRLDYARDGRAPAARPPTATHVVGSPTSSDAGDAPLEAAALYAQRAILRYAKLRNESEGIMNAANPALAAVPLAATLGVGVDVQGAIALHAMVETTADELTPACAKTLIHKLEERISELVLHLRKHRLANDAFQWAGNTPVVDERGTPRTRSTALKKWLQDEEARVRLENLSPVPALRPSRGSFWIADGLWTDIAACRPLLSAWSELARACQLGAWLTASWDSSSDSHASLHGGRQPTVRDPIVVPRLRSVTPDWEYMFRLVPSSFQQIRNKRLGVLELHQLYLRCWAATCWSAWPQDAQLARIFANGEDPVILLTERLRQLVGASRPDGDEPPSPEGDEVDWNATSLVDWELADAMFEQFVDTMLWAMSRGMTTTPLLRDLLEKNVFALDGLNERSTQNLRMLFQRDLYPESYRILVDRTLEVAADRLQVGRNQLFKIVIDHVPDAKVPPAGAIDPLHMEDLEENLAIFFRKALEPNAEMVALRKCIEELIPRPVTSPPSKTMGPNDLRELILAQRHVTDMGHVGPPAYGLYHRVEKAKDIADEIRKQVAFTLVKSGYRFTAIAGDKFLIELDKAEDFDWNQLDRIVTPVLAQRLGAIGPSCLRFTVD